MRSGEARLAVDCGSAGTVGVVAWSDGRWVPLLFDGASVLPSAVLVQADGGLLTGQAAWRAAVEQPDGFVVAPLRSGTGRLAVGDAEVEVLDLVAATLRRVGDEAVRVAGVPVGDVRLVVPAGWGPRRRTWLRQAAHRAGLGQPRLVEAPVAVGDHLLAAGCQWPVGSFVVVCDVGGGFEVTVLRRGAAGFEVLSTLHDADVGGDGIDQALTATLTPSDSGDLVAAGARWATAASVRAGKEALSQLAAVTVPMPAGPAVVVNGALLEQAAGPVLHRAARLVVEAVAAAEISISDVAGVYCVGGGARTPLTGKAIAEETGVAPVVVAEPELAAARGAADAGAASPTDVEADDGPPVPPVRRAVGIAVPVLASLALLTQFLLTAVFNNGSRIYPGPYYYVVANEGELSMAATFAVVACLAAGTILASVAVARSSMTGGLGDPGVQIGTGILAAASLGVAVAGLYAVTTSLYFGLAVGPFLRWALAPIAPVVAVAVVAALAAARGWRTPRGGWSDVLAFPIGSVAAAAVGMLLVQYSATADRWPELVLWIDLAGRLGGLLLGVGVVMAVVSRLVLRLILAAPVAVITAALAGWRTTGILAVVYAAAVALWWIRRLWPPLVRSVEHPVHAR